MAKTLMKVQRGAKKKYVKLEEVCFSDFLSAVQEKFLIPEDTILKVTDDHGVEVDEDVFPELAAKEICFVIYTDDERPLAESSTNSGDCSDKTEYVTLDLSVLQQGGEVPSSPSLTDTVSVSSSLSSDTSDSGCKGSQPLDSNHARNTVERILTSKPAGMTVIKEYEETGSLKDSTRRIMLNIIVAHMREKEGSHVNKATKEFHALGIVSRFPALKDPYSNKGYKMRETFQYRQQILHGPQHSADVLQIFPRFLDTKGLILQLLQRHLTSALNEGSDTTDDPEWDSDMSSLLVLLHLLTPQPTGRKRPKKISIEEATDHLVKFQKSCQSLEDHLMTPEGGSQPYLLATGTSKAQVFTFYVVLDKKLVPCQSCTSLGAFDELFKSHFVFSVKYDDSLSSLYTFLQTTV